MMRRILPFAVLLFILFGTIEARAVTCVMCECMETGCGGGLGGDTAGDAAAGTATESAQEGLMSKATNKFRGTMDSIRQKIGDLRGNMSTAADGTVSLDDFSVDDFEIEGVSEGTSMEAGETFGGASIGNFSFDQFIDSLSAGKILEKMHENGVPIMKSFISDEFSKDREFFTDSFFRNEYVPAMKKMMAQSVAVIMQQALSFGMFLDANEQMDVQRTYQRLQAEAQKDYQPSEDFCWFGTNVRSLASSELQGQINATSLSRLSLARQLGSTGTAAALGEDMEKASRWKQFTTTYCNPDDNNRDYNNPNQTGLRLACGNGAADRSRRNRDIDYTRLFDTPHTLDVNFTDASLPADEEDVQAFLDNVFPPLSRSANAAMLNDEETQPLYLALRSVAAKRGVAQNSFNAIVGMKSSGTSDEGNTREFLGAIMRELGMADNEIYAVIGDKPSYYAQLEILAKRIYQSPGFYTKLYDKPANVERKLVALQAIELMVDRAMYESEARQEMLMSVLLASRMGDKFNVANKK